MASSQVEMSDGLQMLSNPWVNPYIVSSKDHIADPGVDIRNDTSGGTTHVALHRSCPAIVIPGYMKAGSTAFYEMLCQHPMVLSQMKGPHGFSEGELYFQSSLASRYKWTPSIEPDEPFTWFDVGLYYGERGEANILKALTHDCVR